MNGVWVGGGGVVFVVAFGVPAHGCAQMRSPVRGWVRHQLAFFHQNDGEGQPSGLCEANKRGGAARCVHGIILVAHFLLVRCKGATNGG